MREVEKSAASVEEAIDAALEELGVSEQGADVEVVQEPHRGILRKQDAVVKVRVREAEVDPEMVEAQAEFAADFVEGLLDLLDLGGEIDFQEVSGSMYVDVIGGDDAEEMGLLIGKHGQTLDALQDLVRTAVQRKTGERCRVMIDIEDYRKRRRRQLQDQARKAARRVKESGDEYEMEPMNPYERKIVHDAAAEVGGLVTESEGEELDRRVVIKKKG